MSRKKIVSITLLIAMLAVVGLGAVSFSTARAQSTNESLPAWGGDRPFPGRMGKGAGFGAGDEALAEALGISVEELQAARQQARDAALEKAVAEGLITQKQADLLQSNESGFPFGNRLFAWLSQNGIDMDALLADALGISVDELNEARQKAVEIAIDQAVANGEITQEQADLMKARRALAANENFINTLRSAFEAAVKKAVEEGVITQAQADLILDRLQSQPGLPGFHPFGGGMDGFPPLGRGEGGPVPPAQTP